MTTDRQRELEQLSRAIQSGNYDAHTIARFKELVRQEVQPLIEAAIRPAVAQVQRRNAARRAGIEAGRRAGQAAAAEFARRQTAQAKPQPNRGGSPNWREIADFYGRKR